MDGEWHTAVILSHMHQRRTDAMFQRTAVVQGKWNPDIFPGVRTVGGGGCSADPPPPKALSRLLARARMRLLFGGI